MPHAEMTAYGNAVASLGAGLDSYRALLGDCLNLTKRLQALQGQPAAVLRPLAAQLRATVEGMAAVAASHTAAASAVRTAKGPVAATVRAEMQAAASKGRSIDALVAAVIALERAEASLPNVAMASNVETLRAQCDRLSASLGEA